MKKFFPLILVTLSTLFTLVLLELILPLVVPVTDDVVYAPLANVGLRLEPGRSGRYIREGIDVRFSVNAAGFNNEREYRVEREPGVARVVVVGDSFVEALQVDYADAFFKRIETQLDPERPTEVLSFGISGNGTSQVVALVEEVVLDYRPDALVYVFIPNDIADSSPCKNRSRWSRQFELVDDDSLSPLPFESYSMSSGKRIVRSSRLLRYILYQRRLLESVRAWRAGGDAAVAAGLDTEAEDACTAESWKLIEALLVRLDTRLGDARIPWLLVWQGAVEEDYHAAKRERLREIAARRNLPYRDFSTELREAAAQANVENFRIPTDGHWNAGGHAVIGAVLARELRPLFGDDGS